MNIKINEPLQHCLVETGQSVDLETASTSPSENTTIVGYQLSPLEKTVKIFATIIIRTVRVGQEIDDDGSVLTRRCAVKMHLGNLLAMFLHKVE